MLSENLEDLIVIISILSVVLYIYIIIRVANAWYDPTKHVGMSKRLPKNTQKKNNNNTDMD